MKKFISALSSLVIAATAMGGALAISSDAATNGSVDSTIIEFRSNGKNAVTAKAGEKVPVSMYIPQSSGFYSLSLKMTINGKETLGKGTVTDLKGGKHENYKYAFGNYGIKLTGITWPDVDADEPQYFCLNSGAVHDNSMFAGYYNADSMTFFTDDAMNISYQAVTAINEEKNIDALAPWVAAGKPEDYSKYTPVYTWTKDEKWAYDYEFVKFNLELPADLADGTYTFDVYYDEYYNTNPSALFDEKTNEELPDAKKTIGTSGADGVKGKQKLTSVPLKITVGTPKETEAPKETTAAPKETEAPKQTTATPTTTVAEVVSGDAIVYDLIPKGKEYKAAAANAKGNNVYNAQPGEEIVVDWTVKNDLGTAGLQMHFDFSEVEYVSGKLGNAYKVQPQFNDKLANISKTENAKEGGQVLYVIGGEKEYKAKEGATIYSFTVKAPEKDGTYSIIEDTRDENKVIPRDQNKPHKYIVHGLDIVVGKTPETTTAPVETTKAPETTVTTAAPVETTKAPVETTKAPAETTKAPAETTKAPEGTVLYGDVNCDGAVQINDVVLLNRYLNKTADVTDQGKKNADCDGVAGVDSKDSSAIQEFLARIIKSLPKKA